MITDKDITNEGVKNLNKYAGCFSDEQGEQVGMQMFFDGAKWALNQEPFNGSHFTKVNENIQVGCISKDGSDLLDKIMQEWDKHELSLKEQQGDKYVPSHYQFAYWLVRWSGLIQPNK